MRTPISAAALVFLCAACSCSWADTAVHGYYTGDSWHNIDGGVRTGETYLSDAGLMIASEFDGWPVGVDSTLFVYLLWNNGNTFSDRYVGDWQAASNIDADKALRLYEFWYEQNLNDDIGLRFGLYDLNSEFDAIETAALFIHSSHGIGAEYAASGLAGPSIFPVTSMAARFEMALSPANVLRYAILDGVPGDPNNPQKTTIDLGGGDGVLHALEYNHAGDNGIRWGIGAWLYSADFDRIEATSGRPQDDGNGGLYGFIDAPLIHGDSGMTIDGFLRYGVANENLNSFDSYIGAGVVVTGLNRRRPDDQFGIALASARVGDPYRRSVNGAADRHETSIELTFSAQVTDWLRIQPDLQYIINPGANPVLRDALVFGFRFELSLDHVYSHVRH